MGVMIDDDVEVPQAGTMMGSAPPSERPTGDSGLRLSVFERHSTILRSLAPRIRVDTEEPDTWHRHMMLCCVALTCGFLFMLMLQTMMYSHWCATAPGSLIVNRPDGSVRLQPLSAAQLEQFKAELKTPAKGESVPYTK